MHQKPILLRRTGSSLPGSAGSGGGGAALAIPAVPGPSSAIPIADEDPGDLSLSASTHKRKQSGLPLEAETIIHRASFQTSMERIVDDEEGIEKGLIQMIRSQEQDFVFGPSQPSSPSGPSPEISGLVPANERRWSFRALVTPRGLALAAFLTMAVAYVIAHPPSPENLHVAGSSTAISPAPNNPDSKGIIYGEYHDEEVGAPMEHTPREYNKIIFYESPDRMKQIYSKGPVPYSDKVGGLHLFESVCLTTNTDALRYRPDPDTGLRGLIFFTDDEDVVNNPKRCVPCSNLERLDDWDDEAHTDAKVVGHWCGMNGLHTMYASSVGDWSDCIMEEQNRRLMERWGQTQSPMNVSTVHFFQEPTFLLQFNALDMERSLFDMLMTYIPHWDKFLGGDEEDWQEGFPFRSVISHSVQGCLSHSHNWFCEVLHQMYAFGEALEIPWESNENTLYCYRELYYNQMGYQRNLDHEGLITKENFGEFREILFRKFGLPRRRAVDDRKREAQQQRSQEIKAGKKNEDTDEEIKETKIIFYDNKLSEKTVWNEMVSLVSKARKMEKYLNVKFVTVNDFDDLTVAQQARKFNEADAVIMAHGGHMANAIFAVDGTSFVELGCKVESLIGNPKFMGLIDGKHRAVERCDEGSNEGSRKDDIAVCVRCANNVNFTVAAAAFEQLIDDVVASLKE